MSSLDKLMNLEGADAAFEFSPTGELTDHRLAEGSKLKPSRWISWRIPLWPISLSPPCRRAAGKAVPGQGGFYPVQGFTLVGLEFSTVGNGERGVVLRNDSADFEAAYAALDS